MSGNLNYSALESEEGSSGGQEMEEMNFTKLEKEWTLHR